MPLPRTRGPILELLASATRTQHLALERRPLSRAMIGRGPRPLTPSCYACILHAQLGFARELEATAERGTFASHPGLWTPEMARSDAAARDLEALELPASALPLPVADGIAGLRGRLCALLEDHDAAIGWLYVWEGSTLGAELLADHIDAQLHVGERALRFYRGYPDNRGHFSGVAAAIEAACARGAQPAVIVEGARAGFGIYARLWTIIEESGQ